MVQGGKKSGLCKRKSKIAHNFFKIKATDLKAIFLKSPWKMGVEMCDDMGVEMIFVLNKKLFFTFFRPNLSN